MQKYGYRKSWWSIDVGWWNVDMGWWNLDVG